MSYVGFQDDDVFAGGWESSLVFADGSALACYLEGATYRIYLTRSTSSDSIRLEDDPQLIKSVDWLRLAIALGFVKHRDAFNYVPFGSPDRFGQYQAFKKAFRFMSSYGFIYVDEAYDVQAAASKLKFGDFVSLNESYEGLSDDDFFHDGTVVEFADGRLTNFSLTSCTFNDRDVVMSAVDWCKLYSALDLGRLGKVDWSHPRQKCRWMFDVFWSRLSRVDYAVRTGSSEDEKLILQIADEARSLNFRDFYGGQVSESYEGAVGISTVLRRLPAKS
jgi:hypothetical protein